MVEIIAQNSFRKEIKRLKKKYRTIAQDFAKLLGELEKNPYAGADLGKGVRKVRMAVSAKGKGKSDGARVITWTDALVCVSEGKLYLLTIYDKAEKPTISDKEIESLLRQIE